MRYRYEPKALYDSPNSYVVQLRSTEPFSLKKVDGNVVWHTFTLKKTTAQIISDGGRNLQIQAKKLLPEFNALCKLWESDSARLLQAKNPEEREQIQKDMEAKRKPATINLILSALPSSEQEKYREKVGWLYDHFSQDPSYIGHSLLTAVLMNLEQGNLGIHNSACTSADTVYFKDGEVYLIYKVLVLKYLDITTGSPVSNALPGSIAVRCKVTQDGIFVDEITVSNTLLVKMLFSKAVTLNKEVLRLAYIEEEFNNIYIILEKALGKNHTKIKVLKSTLNTLNANPDDLIYFGKIKEVVTQLFTDPEVQNKIDANQNLEISTHIARINGLLYNAEEVISQTEQYIDAVQTKYRKEQTTNWSEDLPLSPEEKQLEEEMSDVDLNSDSGSPRSVDSESHDNIVLKAEPQLRDIAPIVEKLELPIARVISRSDSQESILPVIQTQEAIQAPDEDNDLPDSEERESKADDTVRSVHQALPVLPVITVSENQTATDSLNDGAAEEPKDVVSEVVTPVVDESVRSAPQEPTIPFSSIAEGISSGSVADAPRKEKEAVALPPQTSIQPQYNPGDDCIRISNVNARFYHFLKMMNLNWMLFDETINQSAPDILIENDREKEFKAFLQYITDNGQLLELSEAIRQLHSVPQVNKDVITKFQELFAVVSQPLISKQATTEIVVNHFINEANALRNNPVKYIENKQAEKSEQELRTKLIGKPPMSLTLGIVVSGLIGALIGMVVGAAVGFLAGGVGAIPGAVVGAVAGFMTGTSLGTTYGFFRSENKHEQYQQALQTKLGEVDRKLASKVKAVETSIKAR